MDNDSSTTQLADIIRWSMTQSSEKFCLKWNDFRNNIESTYKEIRENPEFSHGILLCEDHQQIELTE